ncbi:DUF4062 domain-containing protein [Lacisediminihabitans sp. H27-G8]|uniref:DUF4062 domain-containing protein n=1 Tax=Lacisediminihabitans sp. H27-G8 TaxID=3111909 RepID=UPI0038FC6782
MTYSARVVRVMIASPSDTRAARDAVEEAISKWNDANSANRKLILHPWRWETSAVPLMGGHPQAMINSQGVDKSDIVFALFGSRLGSPTSSAVSGTVEEIERAVKAKKPVHLYFSKEPLPADVDTQQLDGLRAFRSEAAMRGLLGEFKSANELAIQVWRDLEHDLVKFDAPDDEENFWGHMFLGRNSKVFGWSNGKLTEQPDERLRLLIAVAFEEFDAIVEPHQTSRWPELIEVTIDASLSLVPDSLLEHLEALGARFGHQIRLKSSQDGLWIVLADDRRVRGKWKPRLT